MDIRLVSSERGYHDFDVSDAGSIYRVTVSNEIQKGDSFNIYYGESSKSDATWLGAQGVQGYLTGDLEKSLRESAVFKEENPTKTLKRYQCGRCGSDDIEFIADVRWNIADQRFDVSNLIDMCHCSTCNRQVNAVCVHEEVTTVAVVETVSDLSKPAGETS